MLAFQMNMPMWEKREGIGDNARGSKWTGRNTFIETAGQYVSLSYKVQFFYVPDLKNFLLI